MGGRGHGGGGRGRLYTYRYRHCHHQNDFCIKMGSDESHFNVSLIVMDKVTRQCPTNHNLWRERRTEADSNRGPSSYQSKTLPLVCCVCGDYNTLHSACVETTIYYTLFLWRMQYNTLCVCRDCSTLHSACVETAVHYTLRVWRLQYITLCSTLHSACVETAVHYTLRVWRL